MITRILYRQRQVWNRLVVFIFLFIWQLPQNCAGLLFLLFLSIFKGVEHREYYCRKFIIFGHLCPTGVSLGIFVFVKGSTRSGIICHELGHCVQSEKLGPLYLLVVGIPSASMKYFSRFNDRFRSGYYNRFPENWADRLGRRYELRQNIP